MAVSKGCRVSVGGHCLTMYLGVQQVKFLFTVYEDARRFRIEIVCLCRCQGCGRHTQCALGSSRHSILGAAEIRVRLTGVRNSYVMQLIV